MARSKRGRRYTAAQKAHILSIARRQNLNGPQVKKQFGVSTLTFYRWRGPVRKVRAGKLGLAANGTAGGLDLRSAVREHVQRVLPGIIHEQIDAYLAQVLATPRRRHRKRT